MLLATSGRPSEAEAAWRAVLSNVPGWPPAAFSLALQLGEQARWREAAELLEACVRGDPTYPRARYNLGLAYAALGDETRATAMLAEAVTDPSARADALGELIRRAAVRGEGELKSRLPPAAAQTGADPATGRAPARRE